MTHAPSDVTASARAADKCPTFRGTQGPWRITRQGDYAEISGGGWCAFARVAVRLEGDAFDSPEGIVNARTIAVADQMLILLQEAVLSSGPDYPEAGSGWHERVGKLLRKVLL